jgi:exodeoxyribonuclease VII small subunit
MAEPDRVGERGAPQPQQADGDEVDGRTFEQLMAELEAVTERLATGELGIEAAADLYERAERLHAQATARLAQVQARVEALTASGRAGGGPGGEAPRRA